MIRSAAGRLAGALLVLLLALPAPADEARGLGKLFRKRAPAVSGQAAGDETGGGVEDEGGPVVKVCGVKGRSLGRKVADAPGGWSLHDPAPGAMSVRAFAITGFKDRCARQITGAVAVFGSSELYEVLHFGTLGRRHREDPVAVAYAKLRAGACGTATGRCPPRGQAALSRNVVFVTIYPSAGSIEHIDLLLSRGRLLAITQR
ncbi:hypothetical protein [Tropicimonas sp. IMCC34043]|uniref:hypothetical protein n=1 Tax=Tropicimonas sp. IMCC34043 TaxID=2248760 RepID=UPI000E27FF60|nr:hypothetical protein [Tropicimonas sp. IMCC34043]